MKFIESYPIEKLHTAEYNPRKIAEGAFEKLKESLSTFGVVKAVVVNQDGTLIAGHQRTKAMKAVGITEVPIFLTETKISKSDEIKFNLLHNRVEEETCIVSVMCPLKMNGFTEVQPEHLNNIKKGNAVLTKEICGLMTKYGAYGTVIADEAGNIVHNADYAFCCKLMNLPVVVYQMSNEMAKKFLEFMKVDYGTYHFENLNIKSYVQNYAQMNRSDEQKRSFLYENFVLKNINKEQRIVDFGAGKRFYINKLMKAGYKAHCYEPFVNKQGNMDIKTVIGFINDLEKDISANGLYDVVILDSVINSVINDHFQDAVLTTCNALCSPDGTFYTATRNIEGADKQESADVRVSKKNTMQYLDGDNYSVRFRAGTFTVQKFHTPESFTEVLHRYFEEVETWHDSCRIVCQCRKPIQLDKEKYFACIDEEFNMEYPNGYFHNKQGKLVQAILDCH